MKARELEHLFVRFQRHGDSAALAMVFDRAAPEVLRVAVHLARDVAQAEDLLQSTFLEAIETADRFDSSRMLIPWLLGILANLVRREQATRQRIVDPNRLQRQSPIGPSEVAEGHELSGKLGLAIDRLREPYRGVLVLHWMNGLSATEIAFALERSPGTVRSQIARGMELLRKALPTGLASAVILAPTKGLAAIRTVVLAKASVHSTALMAAGIGIGGLLLMKKITLLFLGAILLVGLFFYDDLFIVTAQIENAAQDPIAEATLGQQDRVPPGSKDGGQFPETAGLRRKQSDAESMGYGSVAVTLRWKRNGTPVVQRGVQIVPTDGPNPNLHAASGTTDKNGIFRTPRLRIGQAVVQVSNDRSENIAVVAGAEHEIEILLEHRARVEGLVLDQAGEAVAGAQIWIYADPRSDDGYLAAQSGPDGSYSVDVGADLNIGARKPEHAPSVLAHLQPRQDTTVHHDIRLRGPCGSVRGRVRNADGEPIAEARVLVGSEHGQFIGLLDGTIGYVAPARIAVTDAGGRFHVEGVPTHRHSISARAIGFGTTKVRVHIEAGKTTEVEIRLNKSPVIRGQVTDQYELAIVGAVVETVDLGSFHSSRSKTDGTGFFRIEGLATGKIKLRAYKSEIGSDRAEFVATSDTVIDWNPVLKPGLMIKGRLLDDQGSPLAHWRVKAQDSDFGNPRAWSTQTDDDGHFRFLNRKMVRHSLSAFAPGLAFFSLRKHNVLPGRAEIELRVATTDMPSSLVRGAVHDQTGQPALQAQLFPRFEGAPYVKSRTINRHTGQFKFGPWPAGRYRLMIKLRGYPILHVDEFLLMPGQTRDLGTIRMLPPGNLIATHEDGQASALIDAHYSIVGFSAPGTGIQGALNKTGLKAGPLGQGRYILQIRHRVNGRDQHIARFFEIQSGKTTQLTFRPRPSHERRLQLVHEDGIPVGFTWIRVHDLEGTPVDAYYAFRGNPMAECTLNLPSGQYKIEALEHRNGFCAEQIIEISAASTAPIVIKLR